MSEIKYFDKGVESVVYRTADDTVRKFRQIHPYSANAVIDELARLVYHNYLFPRDAYVLNDILRYEEGGFRFFFLDVEQPFVTPRIVDDGIVLPPTYPQIQAALRRTPLPFRFHMDGAASSSASPDGEDGSDEVPVAKMIAYNEQFMVYDFQPGRNTFIDAETGEVRFIDPRVEINAPGEPHFVSRFGARRRYEGPLLRSLSDLGI